MAYSNSPFNLTGQQWFSLKTEERNEAITPIALLVQFPTRL